MLLDMFEWYASIFEDSILLLLEISMMPSKFLFLTVKSSSKFLFSNAFYSAIVKLFKDSVLSNLALDKLLYLSSCLQLLLRHYLTHTTDFVFEHFFFKFCCILSHPKHSCCESFLVLLFLRSLRCFSCLLVQFVWLNFFSRDFILETFLFVVLYLSFLPLSLLFIQ